MELEIGFAKSQGGDFTVHAWRAVRRAEHRDVRANLTVPTKLILKYQMFNETPLGLFFALWGLL